MTVIFSIHFKLIMCQMHCSVNNNYYSLKFLNTYYEPFIMLNTVFIFAWSYDPRALFSMLKMFFQLFYFDRIANFLINCSSQKIWNSLTQSNVNILLYLFYLLYILSWNQKILTTTIQLSQKLNIKLLLFSNLQTLCRFHQSPQWNPSGKKKIHLECVFLRKCLNCISWHKPFWCIQGSCFSECPSVCVCLMFLMVRCRCSAFAGHLPLMLHPQGFALGSGCHSARHWCSWACHLVEVVSACEGTWWLVPW